MKELKRLIVYMMIVLLVVSTLPLMSASSKTQNGTAPYNIETAIIPIPISNPSAGIYPQICLNFPPKFPNF